MGGSPFGPAGTGKTESVKALGMQMGRFTLVFNCDETFDGNAMGRIFVGLCQVGAWGCFDEFNRLEERMLSAVSQQILTIQTGLREHRSRIEMMGKDFILN
jgi:dynein heavy chain 1, cytosolic